LDYGTDFGLEFDEKEALTHEEIEYITNCDHEGMHPETASSSRQQSTSFDTDTDQDLDDEMQDEASADKSGWNLLTGLGVFMLLIFVAFCYYLIKDLTARIVYRIKEGKWPESESSMRKR